MVGDVIVASAFVVVFVVVVMLIGVVMGTSDVNDSLMVLLPTETEILINSHQQNFT